MSSCASSVKLLRASKIPVTKGHVMKMFMYLKLFTVEPTLFLYMMAFMTTSVIEQAFFIDKACRVNHKFNATICDSIEEHKAINREVQITVSNFLFKNDIAGHTGQIFMALFMGAWSDKRGRKLPLLIGLVGKLYYSVMIVVNAVQDTWPVEYIAYTATLPMAFTGADVIIFAAAFTYLVDVTSQESRTVRVTLLEVCYLITMPIGVALGSYLFTLLNKSYAMLFTINSVLMALSILYTIGRLEWQTKDEQRPLSEAENVFLDFFDYNHLVGTARTIFKRRPCNRRTYLLMLIIMMGLYTFQRDEKHICFLYLQLVFQWSVKQISHFRIYLSALQAILLLSAIRFFSKMLGWRDTIIVMIGATAHFAARLFYVVADVRWMFYIGGTFASLGPIVAPVIRSMVSKLVANSEKGKAFSVLSVADNALPLISGVSYSKLYNYTINTHPESFFYLTIATQIVVCLMSVYIHFRARDNDLIHEEESHDIYEESDRIS